MKTRVTFALCVVSLALGCSSDPATPPASATTQPIPTQLPATLTATQFLAYQASVECASMFACAAEAPVAALRAYLGEYARCVARADVLPGDSTRRRTAASLAAGRLRFDEPAARRCLAALRASMCDRHAECDSVFVGAVAAGGACFSNDECAGDNACTINDGLGTVTCPGRCEARVPVGGLCDTSADACSQVGAAGVVECLYDPAAPSGRPPFRCVDRGAEQIVPEGGDCNNSGSIGGPIRSCATGLECRYVFDGSMTRQTCNAPAPAGTTCSRYCQAGSLCEFDSSRFEQRCLPFTVRSREGETCVQGNNGSEVCNVLLGLDCVAGRCRRIGSGAEGSVCFGGRFNVTSCNAGLFCSPATGTCVRRKADGAACSTDDECESRWCSDDSTGATRCIAFSERCS